jgi:hypothetical protein
MRNSTPETRAHKWMMHYIRHTVPNDKPYIGCDVEDWAAPDDSRLLRSEITCAVSLMIERMIRPEFVDHKICPVCTANLLSPSSPLVITVLRSSPCPFHHLYFSMHVPRHSRSHPRKHVDSFPLDYVTGYAR